MNDWWELSILYYYTTIFKFLSITIISEGLVPRKWCFQIVVRERTLESPLDSKEIQSANLKEIDPQYSLEGLMLKFQYFGRLMWRANSLEKTLILGKIEGRRRKGWQRRRWLNSITDSMDMNLSKFWATGKWRSLTCCSPWGHKESDTT